MIMVYTFTTIGVVLIAIICCRKCTSKEGKKRPKGEKSGRDRHASKELRTQLVSDYSKEEEANRLEMSREKH